MKTDPIRPWMYAVLSFTYLAAAVVWEFRWPVDVWTPLIFSYGGGMMLILAVVIDTLERK